MSITVVRCESWERAAAGIEDMECLGAARGLLYGLSVSCPIDLLLLWLVWP